MNPKLLCISVLLLCNSFVILTESTPAGELENEVSKSKELIKYNNRLESSTGINTYVYWNENSRRLKKKYTLT